MKKIDIRDIRSEEILAVNRGENTLFQRRENLSKHTFYARERMQYDAIRSGQVEQILSLLQQKPDGTEGILSKDQLRNSKNMFIAGITLFTRAAIDGGVPEETAYSLSDGYIQTVEECTNSVSIEKLSQRAAARIHNLQSFYGCFCLLEVINKSIFFALTQVGKEQNEQTKNHH